MSGASSTTTHSTSTPHATKQTSAAPLISVESATSLWLSECITADQLDERGVDEGGARSSQPHEHAPFSTEWLRVHVPFCRSIVSSFLDWPPWPQGPTLRPVLAS